MFDFPEDITALSAEALAQSEADALAAFHDLQALGDDLTDEQIDEMEALAAHVTDCRNEDTRRTEAAANRQARIEAAAAAVAPVETEEVVDEEPEPEVVEEVVEDEPEPEVQVETRPVAAAATTAPRRSVVARVPAREVVRPSAHRGTATITAAADIPGVPAASALADMDDVARAFIARSKAFPQTDPNQPRPSNLPTVRHQYGIATFNRGDFGGLSDTTPEYANDHTALLAAAADEKRLPGGSLAQSSLTAAGGGWCAPSETLYDLCPGRESLDGLFDVPEIQVTRGGINYTDDPDFRPVFADLESIGFWQTEAQAIAGTTKTCLEIECPTFHEVRLDAVGICIKAPILTNVAYPEVIRRWIEGSLVAHQHKVSRRLLLQAATALGPAVQAGGAAAFSWSMLTALELLAEGIKQDERMSFGTTLEVVLPHWVLLAVRSDLANRTGVDMLSVSDQQINAHFAARGLRVQFVYNWQGLHGSSPHTDIPDTVQAMMYPAGTFVKGTQDVISLDTMYDSTDLASNMYLATFIEEGVLLAERCGNGYLVEIPVCASGQTGAAGLTDCFGGTDSGSV
jgi:hypothetical protein